MVSTCHVNLLSSPAAFHMHYTPERTVSFSLLLDSKLLSAHLTFLFCVQIITNASRMTWSPWISTSWKAADPKIRAYLNTQIAVFHWWNSPLCSPLMYEALKYLCISSPSSFVKTRFLQYFADDRISQSSDSDLCWQAHYRQSLLTTLLHIAMTVISLSLNLCCWVNNVKLLQSHTLEFLEKR